MAVPSSLQKGLYILAVVVAVCYGREELVNHLILLDSIPPGSVSGLELDIRTNFSGNVHLVEAKDFRVIVNITAPSLQQAYDVDAQIFTHNDKVVLEIKELHSQPSTISLMWLFIGIACSSFIVLFCTAVYAGKWYQQEHQTYDVSDRKSLSSSGLRSNIYKPSNTIPMSHLAFHTRDDGYENTRNLRTNEELKQVQEVPEEDEDEAIDKEQPGKMKLNDVDSSMDTEDSDPQERNLIKSRYHSHSKMIHKDLIKKGVAGKKTVSYKRTYKTAVYNGLPTEQEETSNDEADLKDLKSTDTEAEDSHTESLQVRLSPGGEPTYANDEKLTNVDKSSESAYANDPMRLVSADIHKTSGPSPQYKHISIEKSRVGNIYSPLELKPVLSTFTPSLVSTPKTPASSSVKGLQDADGNNADNDFDKIPHKPNVSTPWSTQNLPVMADILEDPREDQTSVVSDSANSASIYGSSEIFNPANTNDTYFTVDSDTDEQPCDVDDIFSDGELPSPFLLNKFSLGVQTNDDIKLIPGALKSPGANVHNRIHKVRPNSSILFSTDVQDLLNPKKSNKVEETMFEFPPPPQSLLEMDSDQNKGDYIQIKQTSQPNPQAKKTGQNKLSLNQTYLNMTILTTVCLLTLTTGVFCSMDKHETKVTVTVLSPKYLLQNYTRIFFNLDRETEVLNQDNFNLLVYDVSEPLLQDRNDTANKCLDVSCDQGCDETTGQCICFKGYKLNSQGECIDINECMEGKAKCDKAAGCYNRKGSYDCICGEDFYGNGKKCRECKQACPENHYEVQSCSNDIQKICKDCTQKCVKGFYMAKPCSSHENALCRMCTAPCSPGEFESRQCNNDHDRECKNVSLLDVPVASRNVLLEEKQHILTDETLLEKLAAHYVGFSRYTLHRGTGIVVELTVRLIDPTQRFLPKNSTDLINIDKLLPALTRSRFVRQHCQNPIPDYYILQYKKNENQTYKLNENGSIEDCDATKFGENILRMSGVNGSFVCSQPGSLSNKFKIDHNFFLARTKWVDKNKRCQRYSQACESCTRNCGTSMFSGDPDCAVVGDDNDNGLSPRLMMCYNCCVKKNCSSDCKEYHKRRCQPDQCLKGNLLQFTLEPSWESSQDGHFHCHIVPMSNQPLLEMDYSVKSESHKKELSSGTIKIYGDNKWETTGSMSYSDDILDITFDSGIGLVPDILEEEVSRDRRTFKLGNYKSNGAKFGSAFINQPYVFLRPDTPHGMTSMPPAHQECSHDSLNDMFLASNMENLYLLNSKLDAFINFSVPFIVTHKDTQPLVKATLSRDKSILSKIYQAVAFNVSSFSGDLVHNGSHWITTLSGNVLKCPGFLNIRLHGPNYENEIEFSCDTVILCPKAFHIQYSWPTSDKKGMSKDIIIVIKDKKSVHHFRIFKTSSESLAEAPSDSTEKLTAVHPGKEKHVSEKSVTSGRQEKSSLPLDLPYLFAICGVIILLTVLAIIGLVFQPGLPETPMCKWYHPVMATFYMTFQFFYSIVISGSVFFIILTILTSSNVSFLLQYVQSGDIKTASVYVELLQLQNHLETDVKRLDRQADEMRAGCLEDVRKIVADLKKLHQTVLEGTQNEFERHHLTLLLNQQKLHVRDKLNKDLNEFRAQYASAARSVLQQVNQNAQASYQHILHNNSWLVGTKFLFEAVTLLRKTNGQELKTFMEWTGIKSQLSQLEIDLSFSLPALPRLEDMVDLSYDQQPIVRDAQENLTLSEPIRSIEVHNNWFFPLDSLQAKQAAERQSSKQKHIDHSPAITSLPFYVFLGLLAFCDLILLAHRMSNSWTSTKLFIFGFPEYVRQRKVEEDDDVFAAEDSTKSAPTERSCKKFVSWKFFKMFLTQTISTTFFPKITGAIATFFILFCLLRVSNKYLNIEELQKIGLYHTYDHYLDIHTAMTNARLQTHADYINTVDLPIFQTTVNGYVIRHQTVVEIYKKYLHGIQSLNSALYCEHLKAIGVSTKCNDSKDNLNDVRGTTLATCKFQPVVAQVYGRDVSEKSFQSDKQMEATLNCLQNIILQTSQLILIYLAIIILKELGAAVLWIMIERSGIIRLRIIVEKEHDESVQQTQLPGTPNLS
ncbi:CAunnamed protein product [Biomphalaria glabrata]|nr:CAunnamed protein product [Biomphalaria glabrata]